MHQAKIHTGNIRNSLTNAKVRAYLSGQETSTKISESTLSPVWNETLIFNCITVYGSPSVHIAHPPYLVLDLYDVNKVNFYFYCI